MPQRDVKSLVFLIKKHVEEEVGGGGIGLKGRKRRIERENKQPVGRVEGGGG